MPGKAVMRDLARADKVVIPTLRVLQDGLSPEREILQDERLSLAMPQEILENWRTAQENRPDDQVIDPAEIAMVTTMDQNAAALVRAFSHAGGRLVFGRDTPSNDGISNPPGLNGRLKLDAMAKAGKQVPIDEGGATFSRNLLKKRTIRGVKR